MNEMKMENFCCIEVSFTKFGKRLLASGLDELSEVFNNWNGNMSIVGIVNIIETIRRKFYFQGLQRLAPITFLNFSNRSSEEMRDMKDWIENSESLMTQF